MPAASVLVSVLALVGLGTPEAPGLACRLRVHVVASGLTEKQLDLARLQVTGIWRPYGVSIEWAADPPPVRPSGPGVLRVWLSRDGFAEGEPSGSLMFQDPAHPGDRIVVDAAADRLLAATRFHTATLADTVRSVQDRFIAVALGRMLAHEVAHYLLASPDHASRGLLRARFSTADFFFPNDLSRYRLEPAQVERLSGLAPSVCLPPETPGLTTVAAQAP